ncbi:glycoside hydrolase family 15 protein [Nakamurella lactea]|uniref:glycoside hydrolase family 15 protein n=1 Tax=Nakamurella lactea TaxID=459515 RepID=UPI00040A874B|nr:glycoside hydrolase family 15 protein [Nakamurella lactea]
MPEMTTPDHFPPIADYAFLSDCETNCLVAPDGSVEWMCVPRPDSPSIFGAIVDRDAGSFRVSPVNVAVPAARRYLPGTLVLETTWQTPTGWLVVRDALVVGPWHDVEERSNSHRRAPTDDDARHCLLRIIECTYGAVDLSVECEPMFDYARSAPDWEYANGGYDVLQATAGPARFAGTGAAPAGADGAHDTADGKGSAKPGSPTLRLTSSLRFGVEGPVAVARTRMNAGDKHFVALSFSALPVPTRVEEAEHRMAHTESFWREWLTQGSFPDHPWRSYLQVSALALKGLTYVPTGALLAAATTSLPETPGGQRNWDYRYSWIRDSTFALWGLYTLGFDREADDFFYFIHDVAKDDPKNLQLMYGIGGEHDLTEFTLDHLDGYGGARPVRVGNAAYRQKQHDVWGALLDSIYLHSRSKNRLPDELWPIVVAQVESAIANWRDPDSGMWEMRGEPQHFVSSKVMCWVAVDRGVRLATARGGADKLVHQWQQVADEIHADVLANGVDDRGVFVQHYGTEALDASVLLLPLVRFLPADDPRIVATVKAVADELTADGMVLRYRTEETDDGLMGTEGAFTICSFWLVSALVEIGELDQADALCRRLLSHASPLGLYAEEIEPHSGRHLGNFPQAFTHLALINAVTHVIGAQQRHDGVSFNPANVRT